MATNTARLLNIGLRGSTLTTRFLFIFFLAKYLDPASIGYYGIFTASVGYAMYFVGLDFYTYVSREIVKAPANRRGQLLKGQAALSACLYIVLLPIILWLLSKSGWPTNLLWWFLPILILEHFNQELSRLLIALSEQLTSSVILFIRQGSWALAIIVFMYIDSSARNLNAVMALWALAGLLAAAVGAWKLRRLKTEGWRLPIDWQWLKKGIGISTAFLIATLALRGVKTFDRFWLESIASIEVVGAYVLLFGIANTLLAFLDAAVFSFAYPYLIELRHQSKHKAARREVKKLLIQTVVISLIFALASLLVLPYFLGWIGNPFYLTMAHWYPWVLVAMMLNAVSLVPHYALYAKGEDQPIIKSHVAGLAGFIVIVSLSSQFLGGLSILLGLITAFFIILLWKTAAYFTVIQLEKAETASPI